MWKETLKGKRVLVTGHTGFKGSWLVAWLDSLGAKVWGLSLEPDTEPSLFREARLEALLEGHMIGDICDSEIMDRAVERADPDLIVHLAAQPLVRRSYREPHLTFSTNVLGTLNLLESIRKRGKPCSAVLITTDKVYRNVEQVWGYRECDPLGGDDPYSASKAAAEITIHSYRRSFFQPGSGIRVASARGGNVIGGGDWSQDRIVPDLVSALIAGKELEVRSPFSVRPWQHVLDLHSGYLQLAARLLTEERPEWCEAWNFGPAVGDDVTVGELVESFIGVWGSGGWRDVSGGEHPHEAKILRLAIDKSVSELGWRPTWGVSDTVEKTAGWYRDHARGDDALLLMRRDIRDFTS